MTSKIIKKVSKIFRSDGPHSNVEAQHTPDSDNKPSYDIPNNTSSTDIPRNILAFRTITTLLSSIQQERAFQIKAPEILSPQERQELKISGAISTLAVFDSDVVAVVTKRSTPSVWNLILTRNYRWSESGGKLAITPPAEPTFSDAKITKILDDDEKLKTHVDELW